MRKGQYEQIIIIGRTQLAGKCAEIAARTAPCKKIFYFNIGNERPPNTARELDNLEYICSGKTDIMDFLGKTSRRTLVFSIMNSYLFPNDVIGNPRLEIINLHHALLPNHPGRNAEIWAIFEGDDVSGITWHMVTPEVDKGDIILQRQVRITEHMTSFTLFRALNIISIESFPEVFNRVMEQERIETYPQPSDMHYKLRYAKERPADGMLSLEWDIDKMYRFVRAMDYGALKIMGDPVVIIDEKIYTWKKYLFSGCSILSRNIEVLQNEICIRENGKELRLIKTREIVR